MLKQELSLKLLISIRYYILLLSIILITSCSDKKEKCNLKFEQYFSENFITLWNSETRKAMVKNGNEKSILLLDFEKRYNTSFFDRSNFIKIPKLTSEFNKQGFSELWVLEINYAGEKNQIVKYLVGVCNDESYVTKCVKGTNGWIIFEEHKIKGEYFKNLQTVLAAKNKKPSYWGNITEMGCLTQLKDGHQISVKLFESLNKEQFDAISGLNLRR